MILLSLNRESDKPLFQQVIDQLKEKIDNNVLKPGDKLPPTRLFSTQLGVNRTTIYRAYQELWALGYIESKSGSYSFVRERREIISRQKSVYDSRINWGKKVSPNAENVYRQFREKNYPFIEGQGEFDGIDMGRLHPDSRIFPLVEYKKSISKVITEKGDVILDYGEGKGYTPLREFLANRMRKHGISVNAHELLITNGAQNGIDLLMKLFTKPGSRVFVESPTYGMIIPSLQYYECEIVPINMNKDGADLKELEREIQKGPASFFYTMPNFQNPTGITTNQAHREKLIELCEKNSLPIIEDAFEEEMKYFGKVPLPIKSMDINQMVIYLGSFSKILFPGIRLGWMAANIELIDRLSILKRFGDITSALPEQAAIAEFCKHGFYELHIKKIHKIYRKRMILATQSLNKFIKNKNVSWIEPNGGFTIWITLKRVNKSYTEIDEIFREQKIRLALGKDFYPGKEKEKHLRLAIASLDESEIVEGIKRLSQAVELIYKK